MEYLCFCAIHSFIRHFIKNLYNQYEILSFSHLGAILHVSRYTKKFKFEGCSYQHAEINDTKISYNKSIFYKSFVTTQTMHSGIQTVKKSKARCNRNNHFNQDNFSFHNLERLYQCKPKARYLFDATKSLHSIPYSVN